MIDEYIINNKDLKKLLKNPPIKIGERVCCIDKITDDRIVGYGCGEYIGLQLPHAKFFSIGWKSKYYPTIRLDNGSLIYGVECLWGQEDIVMAMIEDMFKEGKKLFIIDDIEGYRKQTLKVKNEILDILLMIPDEKLMLEIINNVFFYNIGEKM